MEPAPHIAVVDDHRDIRELVGRYLQKQGYRFDGRERRCAGCSIGARPDLVVLDITMPGEDGLTLCRELRARGGRAGGPGGGPGGGVPIIFLTARADETDRVIGLELGEKFRTDARATARTELASRAEAVARLIETVPNELEDDIARVNGTDYTRFWMSPEPAGALVPWVEDAFARFEMPLRDLLNGTLADETLAVLPSAASIPQDATPELFTADARWTTREPNGSGLSPQAASLDYARGNGAGVIVPLDGGRALDVAYYKNMPSIWQTHLPFSLGLTAILVSLVCVLTARSIARPLRQLTKAAETLRRGEAVTPLRVCRPDDIRRTAEAFNLMQERLHRFVADRTSMLAAIGHDLRTPLTTLRLRTELVDDADLQERMLDTIDEMQAMTEATLSLARQENALEETRTIDLSALVESVCGDLVELGQPVRFEAGERIDDRCRPEGLRRVIRNLVENACAVRARPTCG